MKQELTKLEMLWIRACKSKEPEKRLVSLYRRFYARHCSKNRELMAITTILANICDEYFPIPMLTVLEVTNYGWKDSVSTEEKLQAAIKVHIRLKVSNTLLQTMNFILPKRFR